MLRIGQVEPSATADGKYTDGSVAGGIAATRLRAAAFNAMQEELANIVESAGMILSPDDMTQVLTALKKQLLSRANPFADIKADGPAAVAAALSNLGLKEAAKRDVGTGDKQLPDMSAFTFSRNGQNGWDVLPNGMIRQFGTVELSPVGNFNKQTLGGVDYYTHYYRVAFPRRFLNAQISTNATLASPAYTVQGSMAGRTLAIHRDTDTGSDVSKTRFVVAYTTPVLGDAPTIHFESIGY